MRVFLGGRGEEPGDVGGVDSLVETGPLTRPPGTLYRGERVMKE